MINVSGYDPATGIYWQFNNKGDQHWGSECPVCSKPYGTRVIAFFGRCRSGSRWFWTASTLTLNVEQEAHGWANSEDDAMGAAMDAVREFRVRVGLPVCACLVHGHASYKLKQLNKAKRAARPAPDTSDARATEYLFGVRSGIRAFPIVKKTAKRIYYKRKHLTWLPEIDAPDIEEVSYNYTYEHAIGFVDRQKLEAEGEVYNNGRHWSSADYHLFAKPPAPRNDEPEPPDLRELKAAMAAAHPDKGGSSAAFIAARKAYTDAVKQLKHLKRGAA